MALNCRKLCVCVSLSLAAASPAAIAQHVALVGGAPSTQNFDTLAQSGSSTTLPDGWYLAESGSNADTSYAADDGSANAGNTYSYGSTGSSDRALGMLLSGQLKPMVGAQLRNETGAALSEIAIAYTGEQWRLGVAGRADRLKVQYSLDASSLADAAASWVDAPALDFSSPNTTAAAGKLNGNLAANRQQISASISGFNLAANATLWLRWVDVDVSGIDDGLAIDDVSFTVAGDPPVDLPPTVASTIPAHNASNVALGASLGITFSEAVTLGEPWFTLVCSVSGSHTATVSGGPVSYTLAPAPAFAANEACTWTILADGVTDRDGQPDHMAADHAVMFTTLDPGNLPPPVVESIQPASGARNVPVAADVRVTFSEAVSTGPGAFALACNANPLELIESGSGSTRTLTPATVLPLAADCTFTVHGGAVENDNGVAMSSDVTSTFSVTDGTLGGYYAQVNTSSPAQLRCSLHATIRDHTTYPYSGAGTSTWTILELAQTHPGNPGQIIDVYRNRAYTKVSGRAGTGSGLTYNREHTWPNSLGFPSNTGDRGLPNAPYTDTHMLYLSDTQWNADRGNKPYADCPTGCGERATEPNNGVGGGSGVYPGNSNWTNANSFQTWNHRKGDMARAVLYMAIRYEGGADSRTGQSEPDLELTDDRSRIVGTSDYSRPAYMGLLSDLLAWHQADPPDAEELARNDLIQSFQGNRNPFIDHPEWATRALFESTRPSVCVLNESIFVDGFEVLQ